MKKIYSFYTLLTLLYLAHPAKAQDGQYWQNEFNPGGFFIPGAVVASDNDSGLFYYNPAIIALHPKTSVSLSANIYQLQSVKMKDAIGKGLDLKSDYASIVPFMTSSTILLSRKNNLCVGYALITQPTINFQATQRQDKQMDVLSDSYSPGNEFYIGQYSNYNYTRHSLAALSAALKLNKAIAIGLTVEGHWHILDYYEGFSSRALVNTDTSFITTPITTVQSNYEVNYSHIGLRVKAGIAIDAGKHHFGALVSSPLLSVAGYATLNSEILIGNLQDPELGLTYNFLASGRQADLPVKYKLPLSIAAGYAFDYGKGQIYVAAEHFLQLGKYNIVVPRDQSFIRPDTGSNRDQTREILKLSEQRKSVTNFAAGLSYRLSQRTTMYASFATNYTFVDAQSDDDENALLQNAHTISWNTYNFQLGGAFRRQRFHMRAGLLLSLGSTSQFTQPVDFDHPNESNFLLGDIGNVKANYLSMGLLISYIHNF